MTVGCLWACPGPGLASVSDSSASDDGPVGSVEEGQNVVGFGPPPGCPGGRWAAAA